VGVLSKTLIDRRFCQKEMIEVNILFFPLIVFGLQHTYKTFSGFFSIDQNKNREWGI
jgi:hypothetical protein